MKKLLSIFNRKSHAGNEALSAYVDGRLDPREAAATEAHLAACGRCAEQLAELRQVRSMLSALPKVPAPRSFRVRQADVERQAPAAPFRTRAMAFAPALSAVAVVLLIGVVWTDVGTRGGSEMAAERTGDLASAPRPAQPEAAMSGDAYDSASGGERNDKGEDEVAPTGVASPGSAAGGPVADAGSGDTPPAPAVLAPSDDAQSPASSSSNDDSSGVRPAYLGAEIGLLVLALAAVGAFVWQRRRVR